MWPFKKKPKEPKKEPKEPKKEPKEPVMLYLNLDDDDFTRAKNAMLGAGFVINETLYNQLPWIALTLSKYRQLDEAKGYNDAIDAMNKRTKD